MKLNTKEIKMLSLVIAIWGVFLIGSGTIMNGKEKTVINTKYNLNINDRKIAQAQAKTNEIKLKDITLEINNPLSVDVKDYLEDINQLTTETLSTLKLDTSLVNINQAGTYQYSISYKKKKYIASITIKEKELPNVTFTLKDLTLTIGDAVSTNPRTYISETISEEVYNNLTLDLSQVNNQIQNNYTYYIIYKGTKYTGHIFIRDPGPTIITNQKENKKDEIKTETGTQIENEIENKNNQ